MRADQKFNKRSAAQVQCNYTQMSYRPYQDASHPLVLVFYGSGPDDGNLNVHMNALEAHRLIEQLNSQLAIHAKSLLKEPA